MFIYVSENLILEYYFFVNANYFKLKSDTNCRKLSVSKLVVEYLFVEVFISILIVAYFQFQEKKL